MDSAIIFMGLCIFIPMLLPAFINIPPEQPVVKEVIKIKYIRDQVPVSKPETIASTIVVQNFISKNDAIDCLLSLGLKKTLAIKKVDSLFVKKNYNSLEEFIIDAFKVT